MKRISTKSLIYSIFGEGISKAIILLSICFTIVGTFVAKDTNAQCSLSTITDVGNSPYMRVATPTSSAVTTTTATLTDVWGAWNSMFTATVTIEYGTASSTSGSYPSKAVYTQTAYNVAGSITTGTGTFTSCNCTAGTSTGTFNANITGLTPNTTYYYRATIAKGASCYYSAEQTFTTLPAGPFSITTTAASSVTATGASTGGNITQLGAVTVTQRGVAYGIATNPTTAGSFTNDGSGSGAFTSNLSGLTPSTTYYVRAYAIGSDGITYYGPNQNFTTTAAFTITTTAASAITTNSASSGGTITQLGAITVASKGVVWGMSANPTLPSANKTVDGSGTATFTSNITGLVSSTTYHIRAYVVGSDGSVSYGPDITFTTSYPILGAISPYAMPPKWMIGKNAGMSFGGTAANFTAGPPSTLTGNSGSNSGQEATVTMCDPTKSIVLYCNNTQIYNGSNGLVMSLSAPNGGHSSTDGAVSCPDPASPTNQFYVFSGNDITGGTSTGINWFLFKNTAGTLSRIDAGPAGGNPLTSAGAAVISEALTVGTDNSGGYWVVGHDQTTTQYKAWHVTTTGVTSSPVLSSGTATGGGGTASVRISPCQNKIAFNSQAGKLEVYTWDNSTGKIGSLIQSSAVTFGYGVEFSPSGNQVYYTSLTGPTLYQIDLTSGVVTNLGGVGCGSWMGGLSLGPDGKIYSANGNAACAKVGVINNPNNSGSSSNFNNVGFTLSTGNTHIGLANEPWLWPNLPNLYNTISCADVNFSYDFKTYFLDNIDTSMVEWDFGSGTFTGRGATPTHTYSPGTYNVRLRVTDSLCHQQWTQNTTINISCVLPVEWLSVSASPVGRNIIVKWSTTSEKNNAYFIVERSLDGQHFTEIGKVAGSINSSMVNQYQFIDKNPGTGDNYYRIVQYDLNNASSYSNVVVASMNNNFTIIIAPNPSQNDFELRISGSDEEAIVLVTDILGRELYNSTISDFNSVHFGSNFAKGTYLVKVISGQNSATQKIIKE